MDRSVQRLRQILLAVLLLAAVFPVLPVRAGWQPLLVRPFRRGVRCAFFFNEQKGFVGITGDVGIYRTVDAGASWIATSFPSGFSGDITQIFMSDTLNGWASIEEPQDVKGNSSPELWRTTDGGLTWNTLAVIGSASCVYQTSRAVVATSRETIVGLSGQISTNGGKTFTITPSLKLTNGIDFVDDTYGVVTGFEATPWLRSADGGQSWNPISPTITDECWSVYAVKGTPIFYTAPERDPNNAKDVATSYCRRSADYGVTWTSAPPMPSRTTGHIAGSGEILYVQTDEDHVTANVNGLFRSIDQGQSWQAVGGPSNQRDTRFVVLGCNGGVIYAFDSKGQIWKTRDGGDGTRVEPPVTPVFTPAVLNLNSLICASDQATLVFKNLYCKDMQVQVVGFADSALSIVAQGGLRFSHVPATPQKFGQNGGDSIVIQWDPKRAYHHDTTITTQVHIRYYSTALGREMDTLITINARASGVAPQFVLSPQSINIDTVHPCLPRDTTIALINLGCDTLFITGADSATVKGVTLLDAAGNAPKFPYVIPPGGAVQFKLHMAPGIAGDYSTSINLHFRHQGIAKDSAVTFTTFVPFENAIRTLSAVDVGPISICRTYDTVITIRNPGCSVLTINSVALKYGAVFSLPGLAAMPLSILPDSTFTFILKFSPSVMKAELDSLILNIKALEVPRRLSIPVSGSGTSGTAFFHSSLSPAQIDFGTRTHCDVEDSVIFTLTNPGCVPMAVNFVRLEGALAPGVTMHTIPSAPSTLIDGDTMRIVVDLSTAVRGGFVGNVHIQYQFQSKAIVDSLIPINANIIHGSRLLSVDTSARDLGTIAYCDTKDLDIVYQNSGCDSLLITERGVTGLGYAVLNPRQLPLLLQAGERDTVKLRFVPVSAGVAPGALSIHSDADSGANASIALLTRVSPTDTLTFFAQIAMRATIGDTIGIRIFSGHPVQNKKLKRLDFTLNYDGDVLTPMTGRWTNFVPNSSLIVGTETRGTSKTASYPIELLATGAELTIDSTIPMMSILFRTSISDSSSTNITFSNILLNGGDAQFQKCTLGTSSSSEEVNLTLLCGDSTIKNYFLYGNKMPLSVHPVYPDPSRRTSTIGFPFELSESGTTELTVVDAGGKIAYSTQIAAICGMNHFDVPQSALGEGAFTYTITHLSTHSTTQGKFVVIR